MKTILESIQDAYIDIISEGVKPKFKTGDKVGIGTYTGDGQYVPYDTGEVKAVGKTGDHTVQFDNRKSYKPDYGSVVSSKNGEPYTHTFNAGGYSKMLGDSSMIVPMETHEANIKDNEEHSVRRNDMNNVIQGIHSKRMNSGNFYKLDKDHAAHLKALIDKHTEADKE